MRIIPLGCLILIGLILVVGMFSAGTNGLQDIVGPVFKNWFLGCCCIGPLIGVGLGSILLTRRR